MSHRMIVLGAGKEREGEIVEAEGCCTDALVVQVRLCPSAYQRSIRRQRSLTVSRARRRSRELLAERGFNPERRGLCGSGLSVCTLHPLLQMLATSTCVFSSGWAAGHVLAFVTTDVNAVWPGQIILGDRTLVPWNVLRAPFSRLSLPSFAEPSAQFLARRPFFFCRSTPSGILGLLLVPALIGQIPPPGVLIIP